MVSKTEKGNIYYVYLHRRKDNNEVFYVGKGQHERATWVHSRNKWWNHIVKKAGGFDVEYVEKGLSEQSAFDLEVEVIKFYRDCGHELCNLTSGGEGVSGKPCSAETREKLSKANKGQTRTAEVRAKISAAHMGNQYNKGRKQSDETKAKIGAAGLGRKKSPEVAAKSANAQKIPVSCSNGLHFASAIDAAIWLRSIGFEKAQRRSICACCRGKQKLVCGFSWKYYVAEATSNGPHPELINYNHYLNPESEQSLPVPPLPPTTVQPSELVAHLLH